MTYKLTLKSITPVTHDTNRLRFDKPAGFDFRPGQATLMTLDRDGWREEERPFTFTSLPDWEDLEFTIKSYPSHDGVTKRIGALEPGDTVLIGEPWGAIEDKGAGTFIAGGAGITPFISILRAREARHGDLGDSTLIFSNAAEKDIILREEWEQKKGLRTVFTLTDEEAEGFPHRKIDAEFLQETLGGWDGTFYICGPKKMEYELADLLKSKGVPTDQIVREDH